MAFLDTIARVKKLFKNFDDEGDLKEISDEQRVGFDAEVLRYLKTDAGRTEILAIVGQAGTPAETVTITNVVATAPNELTITATKANTTKNIEYLHPTTEVWQAANVLTDVPAGTYNSIQVRLVGTQIGDEWTEPVEVEDAPAPEGVDMFFKGGQSNNMSLGPISEIPGTDVAAVTPSVLREYEYAHIYNPVTRLWENLQAGVNNLGEDSLDAAIGIAQRYEERFPGKHVYIVSYSRNGRPIEDWDKLNANGQGGYDEMLNDYFLPAQQSILAMGKTPVIKGFYWMQGESNPGDTTYADKLQTLMDNLIADGGIQATTIQVIGKVRNNAITGAECVEYVNENPDVARLVDTTNYDMNADNLHYTARAQFLCGYTDIWNAVYGTTFPYPFSMAPPAETFTLENTDTRIDFSHGTWPTANNDTDSLGSARYNNSGSGFAGVSITGTRIVLRHASHSFLTIKYDVYINGVFKATVTATGDSAIADRYDSGVLTSGLYHLQVVPRAAYDPAYAWLDQVTGSGTVSQYSGPTTTPA